ncbi:unnamed protein product [Aphanomyces euteiches]
MTTTTIASKCCFAGCTNDSFVYGKCRFHRYRHFCSVDKCMNQAYARRLCVSHGGRRECKADGCTANARSRGFCCRHSVVRPNGAAAKSDCSPSKQSDCDSDSSLGSLESLLFDDSMENIDDFDLADIFDPANQLMLTDLDALTLSDDTPLLHIDVNVVDGFLSALPTQAVCM